MEENNKTGNNIQNYFYGNVKTVVYGDCHINEGIVTQDKKKVTDEQIARALMAINGKNKAIDSQRAWLGACLLLGWKYGYSRNLGDCCKQIEALPIDIESLEFQCKYDRIRMYGSWKFIKEDYNNWPSYTPRDDERLIFEKCLAVAQALEKEIEKQAEQDS